jgi:hypothetical protein
LEHELQVISRLLKEYQMKNVLWNIVAGCTLLMSAQVSIAQEIAIYPKKGQSTKQQEKDKFDCYGWAKKQTQFDPMAAAGTAAPSSSSSQPRSGGAVRGAARGAAGGAIVGGIAGDAGKGAAIGAGAGAVGGGARQRHANEAANQERQQVDAQKKQSLVAFNNAQSACLEGRGYSVK